ncbi:MAG: hypothetical protein Q4E57_09785 [Eubacteriales bacterium]|nr:hypothetical protein [Eubacteriales bacterium]
MSYIIDGEKVTESFFWISLQGLASEPQTQRLLEGSHLDIGGVMYHIDGIE